MKIEIQKVKYNEKSKEAEWFTWKETCDICGSVVREANEMITMKEPDTTEKDYCLRCLNEMVD